MKWYRKSAEQGYIAAQWTLARLLNLSPQILDKQEAIKWFREYLANTKDKEELYSNERANAQRSLDYLEFLVSIRGSKTKQAKQTADNDTPKNEHSLKDTKKKQVAVAETSEYPKKRKCCDNYTKSLKERLTEAHDFFLKPSGCATLCSASGATICLTIAVGASPLTPLVAVVPTLFYVPKYLLTFFANTNKDTNSMQKSIEETEKHIKSMKEIAEGARKDINKVTKYAEEVNSEAKKMGDIATKMKDWRYSDQ